MNQPQYTVLYPRKYVSQDGEKTHWMHVGKAFPAKGGGFDVILYVLPPPNEKNEYRVLIRQDDQDGQRPPDRRPGGPPQHRERSYGPQGGYGPQRGQHDDVPMPGGDEDNIPF